MRISAIRLVAVSVLLGGAADPTQACWFRHRLGWCPAVAQPAQPAPLPVRVRTYLEGDVAADDDENVRARPPKRVPREAVRGFDASAISDDDLWEGSHRETPKTTVVHAGEAETFDDVDGLIRYFESPLRTQERWWRTVIQKTTDERHPDIEMVNVTVKDAWIYEISRQADHDYHLLIGVRPDLDQGRYLNAEISSIRPESPDAAALWEVRKGFRRQYDEHTGKPVPRGYKQPTAPIHIRVTGSVFLDADHDRGEVGHGDIKNFTSWEIHPVTKIEILGD
jgi:hypothetical protein